ncbi:glutaredoxin family protein [Thalassobacillus sp. CUG 92003]|uniref:glutaredoxin family protein n=1 Tax=Thalassobacillus sp. CUG 92003 TaxID=2736641 RepID=UPI0015E69E5F|nr:glutaredoxin family protein [Thalassobacillus sp. CUG 92003]
MDQPIVVYVSNNCSHCDKVVARLEEWELDYEVRNVSDNKTHFKELQQEKIYGTPATFIGDERILGYQEGKLKRTLGIMTDIPVANTDAFNYSYK